jgi:outer membrane lipoprotein-sorting protein
MSARAAIAFLLAICVLAAVPVQAQGTHKSAPAAVASSANPSTGMLADRLTQQQREVVQKVNQYLNQLTALKGTFVQTNADNQRLRGKFYLKRPGLFRFDYGAPSRLVIVSDGRYVAIQDHDLGTDDRWDLEYTAFRMLLRKDVDLLRDGRFYAVQETPDSIAITVVEKGADEMARIALVLSKAPALQLKEWTAKDAQGFDTRIVLGEVARADDIDPALFNPANRARP